MITKKLIDDIFQDLRRKKFKLATSESCSGGLIAHTLTNFPGSSDYFDRGVISYSNRSKIELLNVSENTLKKYGAVSREVAEAMSEGIRKKSKVDIGISTTGIAGPTGGTKKKPVGLVYISISTEKNTYVKKFNFSGDRIQNKKNACKAALNMLLKILKDMEDINC